MNLIFQHVGKFISLVDDQKQFFESLLVRSVFSKRQNILDIGDQCRHQNFVVQGSLKVYYLDERGEEHIAKFAMENWWAFDIQSFFELSPSYYGISCLEDTVVLQLNPSHCNDWRNSNNRRTIRTFYELEWKPTG